MLKRIILTLTFAAALGSAGLCLTDNADARWGRAHRAAVWSYYAPPAHYGHNIPYRMFFRGVNSPPPYYYYTEPRSYSYRPGPQVSVRIGRSW